MTLTIATYSFFQYAQDLTLIKHLSGRCDSNTVLEPSLTFRDPLPDHLLEQLGDGGHRSFRNLPEPYEQISIEWNPAALACGSATIAFGRTTASRLALVGGVDKSGERRWLMDFYRSVKIKGARLPAEEEGRRILQLNERPLAVNVLSIDKYDDRELWVRMAAMNFAAAFFRRRFLA